jgi:threonine/homoserine/homoserine lactone efflux protein
MLAVFPQFLRAEYGSIVIQSAVLGAITALTQIVMYGGVALGAARLRHWLRTNGTAQIWLGRCVGASLIGVAIWTASEALRW